MKSYTVNNRAICGLAVLETSIILSVLFAMLLAVSAVVDYLWSTLAVQEAVDRHLYDTGLKPIEVRARSGVAAVLPRRSEIEGYLRVVVDAIASQILSLDANGFPVERYNVHGYWGSVAFGADGRPDVEGLQVFAPAISAGRLDFPGGQARMEREFLGVVQEGGFLLKGVPTGSYGSAQSLQILPGGVLVGVEAVVDMRETFAGSVVSGFRAVPVIEIRKAVVLRGDIN